MKKEESGENVSEKSIPDQSEKQDVNLPPHNKIKSQSVEWNRIGNEMNGSPGKGESEKEKVAEQVEGDTNSKSQINSNSEEDELEESYSGPEPLVRDWESDHKQILPPPARELALLAASIHLGEGRGILVSDLKRLGLEKDNAERKLYLSKVNGLLVPHDKRIGKQKQYFLTNYKSCIDKKEQQEKFGIDETLWDKDIIIQLIRTLSNEKYQYHHIHMETSLNYKDDYDLFKWNIPSLGNKQKVRSFKLEPRRKCSITISATGTVNISIECTSIHIHFILHMAWQSSLGHVVKFLGCCRKSLEMP